MTLDQFLKTLTPYSALEIIVLTRDNSVLVKTETIAETHILLD